MKIGKKIFVGIYVCLFALTITLSGVIIGFSALNGDFLSQFQMNYTALKQKILSDDYGYYVEMGEYPQTFSGYTSDVTFTDSGEDFTYVAKDGSTATSDVYTDGSGNRYIIYNVAALYTDYIFVDGTATASGDAYFKLEPIKWRILGYYEDSAYTNAVVDSTAEFTKVTSVSDENYYALEAHGDAIVVQSELGLEAVQWYTSNTADVDYTGSTIYNWLNTFYSTILSGYDSFISNRIIDYNDTSTTTSGYCDMAAMTTSENIWLISYTEATIYYSSTIYSSEDRCCSASDFGLATSCFMCTTGSASNYRTGTCDWWFRSSYLDSGKYYACLVGDYGIINDDPVANTGNAVRPAMLLNLFGNDDSDSSGASTVEILSDSYGYYVEMGEYPQTFAGYTSDVSFTDSGEDFTYVAKDGTTATADVYIDGSGNRYIQYTVAAWSTSYTFMDGTATASGDAYFKLEPIKWRILGYYEDNAYTNALVDDTAVFVQVASVSDENYNALVAHCDAIVVQSELALESVQWYTSDSDVDYTGSTIYNWLNTFYSEILSGYDSYLSSRTIDYNDTSETSSSQYDTAALTTSEKVWLISYTEAMTYYSNTVGSSSDRYCSPSDFGLATYCAMNTDYTSNYRIGTTIWWLRSSFLDGSDFRARRVDSNGILSNYLVNYYTDNAVRPAMLINLNGNSETTAMATSVSSTGVGETLLTSTASTETAILSTASVSEKRRFVLCMEN